MRVSATGCQVRAPIEQMGRLGCAWQQTGKDCGIFYPKTQQELCRMQARLARIGSEHPTIAKLGLSMASASQFRRTLHNFVNQSVRYVTEPGERLVHPALTLEAGAGDCDDMAMAAVALARAAGRRARICHRMGKREAHALAQLWLNGRWAPVDCTHAYAGEQ